MLYGDRDELTGEVIAAAIKVHTCFGPGLLESVYEACLAHELQSRGLDVLTQHYVDLSYGDLVIPRALRIDMLVQRRLIIEVKSVDQLEGIHTAQLFTYLRLSKLVHGLLLNFNVTQMKEGIRRVTNFRELDERLAT